MKAAQALDQSRNALSPEDLPVDLQEQIRVRAYELYEQRGREGGQEMGDWLQAEQEVLGTRSFAQAA